MDNNILKCLWCNYLLEDDDLFCPHCGAKIKGEPTFVKKGIKISKKSKNNKSFLIFVIILMLALCGGAVILVNNKLNNAANHFTEKYNSSIISQKELSKEIVEYGIPEFLSNAVINKTSIDFNINAMTELDKIDITNGIISKQKIAEHLLDLGYNQETVDYAVSKYNWTSKIADMLEDRMYEYSYWPKLDVINWLSSNGYSDIEIESIVNKINWPVHAIYNTSISYCVNYPLDAQQLLMDQGYTEKEIEEAFEIIENIIRCVKVDYESNVEITRHICALLGHEFKEELGTMYPETEPAAEIIFMYYPQYDFSNNALNRAKKLINDDNCYPNELKDKLQSFGFTDIEVNYVVEKVWPYFDNRIQEYALYQLENNQIAGAGEDIIKDELRLLGFSDSAIESIDWKQLIIDYFYWYKNEYQCSDVDAFDEIIFRFNGDLYFTLVEIKNELGIDSYIPGC